MSMIWTREDGLRGPARLMAAAAMRLFVAGLAVIVESAAEQPAN
jgi:hypothetical protein